MTDDTQVEIDALLGRIRDRFYRGADAKRFYQDRNVLLLSVTWPAQWLKQRGVTWSGEKYFNTLRELLAGIEEHGATAAIKYFPGYLLKCVQDHLAHHGETYCDEGKKALHAWERALGHATGAAKAKALRQDEDKVAVLAEAHRVLAMRRKATKAPKTDEFQGTLF